MCTLIKTQIQLFHSFQVKSQTIDDAIKVDISEPENRRSTRTGPKNRNYSYEDASDVEEDEEDDEDDEAEENDENSGRILNN